MTVTLESASDRLVETGPDGSFEFQQLPPGDYVLTATLPGFLPARQTFRLQPAETKVFTVTLSILILEHTVVTAAKTGEHDVQATPIAMSVLPSRELERLQVHTVEDLARQTPSVTFSQNTGFAQLSIRGIGTNAIFTGSDPSAAVYIDGVYLARPAMVLADFLDLERVEVLRGPQGTLYGRNAVGGALNVVTKVPTNDVNASARFVAGTSGTWRGDGRLNGPLVPGRVMGTVAFLRGVARGFVRDVDHIDRPLGGDDVTAGLGKLRMVLSRRSELLLSGDATRQAPIPLTYAKVLAVKPGFQVANPADPHEVRTSTPGESRNLQYGASLRFAAQLSPSTSVSSLTAFRKLDYRVLVDTDITELDLTASDVHEIHRQWSEELTVSHRRERMKIVGGLFLFDDADRQPTTIRLGGPRLTNHLDPSVETASKAVFGQTTIGLTRRLTATAGLRYTREDKTIHNQGELLTLDVPVTPVPGSTYAYLDSVSHGAWTPRAGFELRADDRTFTYLSATRGFKSGGFNISSTQPGRGFAPEWAWSYEAGVKTVVANGRAQLNVATFYTDYSNLQVQIAIRPGVLDISNAAAATITGVEIETTTDVLSAFRVGGYLNWLDARYDRYTAVGVGGVTGDVAGRRLNNAPEWAGRMWFEWRHDMGRTGILSLRPEVLWQSTAYFTPFNDTIQRQPAYALVNVTAEIRARRRPTALSVYARNLTGEDYITGTFSSPPPAIGGRPGPSRRVGIEFTLGR